jgi:hypothetical protein
LVRHQQNDRRAGTRLLVGRDFTGFGGVSQDMKVLIFDQGRCYTLDKQFAIFVKGIS